MGRFMQRTILMPTPRRACCHPQTNLEGLLSGLFGGIPMNGLNRQRCCQGLSVFEPYLGYIPVKYPWIYILDTDGFKSEEIKLKVDGNVMYVSARHEEIDGEDVDIIERKRVVKIPEHVDVKKMSCYMDDRGRMIVKAPFVCGEAGKGSMEKRKEGEKTGEPCVGPKANDSAESETTISKDVSHGHTCLCKGKETVPLENEAINHGTEDSCQQSNLSADVHSSTDETKLEGHGVEDGLSRCQSPEDIEKELDDAFGESTKDNVESLQKTEESSFDKMEMVESDGQKYLSAKIETGNIIADSICVQCDDKVLSVHAKRECDEEDEKEIEEIHRRFKLPENAWEDQARAFVSDSGYLVINVPVKENSTE